MRLLLVEDNDLLAASLADNRYRAGVKALVREADKYMAREE